MPYYHFTGLSFFAFTISPGSSGAIRQTLPFHCDAPHHHHHCKYNHIAIIEVTRVVCEIHFDISLVQLSSVDSIAAYGRSRMAAVNCGDPQKVGCNLRGSVVGIRDYRAGKLRIARRPPMFMQMVHMCHFVNPSNTVNSLGISAFSRFRTFQGPCF